MPDLPSSSDPRRDLSPNRSVVPSSPVKDPEAFAKGREVQAQKEKDLTPAEKGAEMAKRMFDGAYADWQARQGERNRMLGIKNSTEPNLPIPTPDDSKRAKAAYDTILSSSPDKRMKAAEGNPALMEATRTTNWEESLRCDKKYPRAQYEKSLYMNYREISVTHVVDPSFDQLMRKNGERLGLPAFDYPPTYRLK